MRNHLILNKFLLALVLTSQSSFGTASTAITNTGSVEAPEDSLKVGVSLRTPTDSTITFKSQDAGIARGIPHLVLKRNGVLTPGFERTLLVSIDHLSIPKSGLFLDLAIETQHSDPDLGDDKNNRLAIWHGIRFVPYTGDAIKSAEFQIIFQQTERLEKNTIPTPTDYYSYRLSIRNAQGQTLQEIRQDNGFLLENEWRVPLPKVLEETPGAAPHQLILYYCDMMPFQRSSSDASTRLKRHEVERYIQTELVPAMIHAFQVQTNVWQMPWYREWTNYRSDEDPKTLSVALGEHKTWYHGPFLYVGDAMISIRVDGTFGEYPTLTEGILSIFHHELFHNQQRNITLHFGGNGDVSGKEDAWKMFSEGTAVLASAVGQPDVEFASLNQPRDYVKRAKAFLGEDGLLGGGLNESYTEIPYHTAVYWRFLYEHCGGLVNGTENPAAGMEIIRHVLETLYQGKVVDVRSSSDTAGALPQIIDVALQQTPSCEFRTYEQSLLRFSEAVYLLRTEDGGCGGAVEYRACGFFDARHIYPTPNAEQHFVPINANVLIKGSIPSSYGIDLMELNLDTPMNHKSLKILFDAGYGKQDEFCVQVWKLKSDSEQAILVGDPRSVCAEGGIATLEISSDNADEISDIGIVITRLDSHERSDPGNYSFRVLRK